MIRLALLISLLAQPLCAEALVVTRNLRPNEILAPEDVALKDIEIAGGVTSVEQAVGQEVRVALYAGRPLHLADLGPPALVERNQVIGLVFRRGGLEITAEGRALDRAAVGDVIRVMNLSSRTTVNARVGNDGAAYVQ